MNTAEGLTPRQFGEQVAERLRKRWNVDVLLIADDGALSLAQKRRLLAAALLEPALAGIDSARRTEGRFVDAAENAAIVKRLADDDGPQIEPNFLLSEETADIVKQYRDQDILRYVYQLTGQLEGMAAAQSESQLAAEMDWAGVIGIGVPMAVSAVSALRAGSTISAAITAGVSAIGLKEAIVFVNAMLAAFLLFHLRETSRQVLGIVINDTDNDFVVLDWRKGVSGATDSNLYMANGTMTTFPEDESEVSSSPHVQLHKRFYVSPSELGKLVCCSVYFADRDAGVRGTEGVMVFSKKDSVVCFAHQFAVPYNADNGTYMIILGAVPDGNLQALYDEMYEKRRVWMTVSSPEYTVTSAMNDASGGVIALITSFTRL